jgi:hypothetical protein
MKYVILLHKARRAKLGKEESKRMAKRKSRENRIERKEDVAAYGEALD